MDWNIEEVEKSLKSAFDNNSEQQLLAVLKKNSFLFYELYSRKYGICPNFAEVQLGNDYRCDFAWLNDNSDGPEWVLVEFEKPNVPLFKKDGDPTQAFSHAINQVQNWRRYFDKYPLERDRIFYCCMKFRFVLVIGTEEEWQKSGNMEWRAHNNKNSEIEIRTMDVLFRSLEHYKQNPQMFYGFEKHPISLMPSELECYTRNNEYLKKMKLLLSI